MICRSLNFFNDSLFLDSTIERIENDKKPGLVNIRFSILEKDPASVVNVIYQIWKPLLMLDDEDELSTLFNLEKLSILLHKDRDSNVVLVHYHGGDFCILSVSTDGRIIRKKSFHKYTCRKKQGGKQSKRKRQGTSGSQMRMLNEKMLLEDIGRIFEDEFWIGQLRKSRFIGTICPGHNNRKFISQKLKSVVGNTNIVRPLPFHYKKANFMNTRDAFSQLARVIELKSSNKEELDKFLAKRNRVMNKKSKKNKNQKKKKKKKRKKRKESSKKKKRKDVGLDEVLFSPLSDYFSPVLSSASSVLSSAGSLLSPIISPILSPLSAFFQASEEGDCKKKKEESDVFLRAIKDLDSLPNRRNIEGEEMEEEVEEETESSDDEDGMDDLANLITECSISDNSEFEVIKEEESEEEEEEEEEGEEGEEEEDFEDEDEESMAKEDEEESKDVRPIEVKGNSVERVVVVFTFLIAVVTVAVLIKKSGVSI